jgi:phage repressor protein C with HTH and peptisase S24 domain
MLGVSEQMSKEKPNFLFGISKMSSKERINQALKESGKKATDLAKEMGLTRGSVSEMLNTDGEAPTKYIAATAKITGFLSEWLTTGQGLKRKEKNEQREDLQQPVKNIPVFDTIATAGMTLVQEDQEPYSVPQETINTGTLFRDATAAMRVYGDSMFPKYQAGVMIAMKEIFDMDNIVFGEDYVVETSEQRVLKRLLKSEKGEEFIELSSINPQKDDRGRSIYAAKDLHLTKIRRIYKVLGQVRYEIGGDTIIHKS